MSIYFRCAQILRIVRWPLKARDNRGATIIEFALVAAPFVALILAILQIAVVFFAQEGLETAAEAASRSIMTGQAQSAGLTQAQFQAQTCKSLPAFFSCPKLMVDVQKASSFSGVTTGAPTITYDKNGNVTNSFSYVVGGSGDIVIVRLMYLWPVITGPLGFNIGTTSNGQRLLIATEVSKTEPYSQ